jgi:hypothetical protein
MLGGADVPSFLSGRRFGDRYEKETKALGFSGLYERYRASGAGFPNDPKAYHGAMFERARQGVVGSETTAAAIEE